MHVTQVPERGHAMYLFLLVESAFAYVTPAAAPPEVVFRGFMAENFEKDLLRTKPVEDVAAEDDAAASASVYRLAEASIRTISLKMKQKAPPAAKLPWAGGAAGAAAPAADPKVAVGDIDDDV